MTLDAVTSAEAAGLRYVSDDEPGFQRRRTARGFRYVDTNGAPIRDEATLQRIRSLAIPPAWTDVWICPWPDGHIQATARDAKGRKQYRYHPRWREARDLAKYDRLRAFGEALPGIRARVEADLARPGLPREKVLAAVVRLLERTHIRVGNDEYARSNESYGLTTLQDDHAQIRRGKIVFEFRGKSGKDHQIDLKDSQLAQIVKRSRDLPGQRLFQYLDENGTPRAVTSGDVNAYLRDITGQDFTAKDFRTWAGTVLCAQCLADIGAARTKTDARKAIVRAVDQTAEQLGNTRAVCRKSYIHPTLLDSYEAGDFAPRWERLGRQVSRKGRAGLEPDEAALMAFLAD